MTSITARSAGAFNVPDFQYEALPNPESHIRLLKLDPSKTRKGRQKHRCRYGSVADHEHDTVACHMTVWPANDTPDYIAISYTWGEDNRGNDSHILINERRFTVGKNCDEALRQARRHDGSKYYWIDAICINQSTDLGNYEKNHQVRIMGDIYRNASHVLACVGPCDETSHRLIQMVRWPKWPRGFVAHAHEWFRKWLWIVVVLRPADLTFLLLYRQFLRRSFFKRVWILQELFLARQVIIGCGSHFIAATDLDRRLRPAQQRLHFEVVIRGNSHSYDWILRLAGQEKLIHWNKGNENFISWDYPAFVHDIIFMSVDHLSLATGSSGELFTPEKAVSQAAALECSEPRDKIYGILSMVRWFGPDGITPDYNKPKLQLAAEYLLALRIEEAYRLQYFVHEVISALAMRLVDADVSSAILVRHPSITTPVPVSSTERQLTEKLETMSMLRLHGRKICEEDDWILVSGLYDLRGNAQQGSGPNGLRFQTLRSKTTGKIVGFVREATKSEDCIMIGSSWDSLTLGKVVFNMALVARQQPPGQQWHMEGPAFVVVRTIEKHLLTGFDVYFNPEDLLILFIQADRQFTRFTTIAHRMKTVAKMLQMRFCQTEGSSYAMQDADDQQKRNDENKETGKDHHIGEGLDPSHDLDNDEDRDPDEDLNDNSGWKWNVIKRVR